MSNAESERSQGGSPWRIAGWTAAGLVLLLPLIGMQFTRTTNWSVGDFIFAGLMVGFVGIACEMTVRSSRSHAYRGGVAAALAASLLTVVVNGAVGMIGDEGNPYNLLFLWVVAIALAGAVMTRFRSRGMAFAMAAAAVAQGAVAAGGISADPRGGILSACFAAPWLLSAALFRKAARDG